MSFTLELTQAQQVLRQKAQRFAREVVRPAADEYDRTQELKPVSERTTAS